MLASFNHNPLQVFMLWWYSGGARPFSAPAVPNPCRGDIPTSSANLEPDKFLSLARCGDLPALGQLLELNRN